MGPPSSADNPRLRKNKESPTPTPASQGPHEAAAAQYPAFSTLSGPPAGDPRQGTPSAAAPGPYAAAQAVRAPHAHHDSLGRPFQPQLAYASSPTSDYGAPRQPLFVPSPPRPYIMYGEAGMPAPTDAGSQAMTGRSAYPEPHWYDASGMLYISTERGLVPANATGHAAPASGVPMGFSSSNFGIPGAFPPSPTTAAATSHAGSSAVSSSAVSSSAVSSGAVTPGATTPASGNAGVMGSGVVTSTTSAASSSMLGEPLLGSPASLAPPAAAASAPAESNPASAYFDADVYAQSVLPGSAPPQLGIVAMPPNYAMPVSVPQADRNANFGQANQFTDAPYAGAPNARTFSGVPASRPNQMHLQTATWKPATYAYGYYPYSAPTMPLYDQAAMPPLGGSMPPGAFAAAAPGALSGREPDAGSGHMLASGESALGKISSSDAAADAEGMGQMTTDAQGIPWLKFEYTRDRVQCSYQIRCDIDNVDESMFSETFCEENCIYPRAMVPPEEYKGHRQHYETVCNQIGWRLAFRNPVLQTRRGLIQRAVDTYRNSSRDVSTRSRRARRILKQQEKERQRRLQQQQPQQTKRRQRTYWPA